MTTGDRIKELRVAKDMTQEELGNIVGVKKAAVQKWESGMTKNLKKSVLQTLSELFNVDPSYIMGMSNLKNIPNIKTKKVPLLGSIAAGQPILANEETRSFIEVDINTPIDFCLEVRGDSMIDVNIKDGDIVFVRKQQDVENGEIAVVLIDNEATLKRVYKMDNGVLLKPENDNYQPMFFSEEDYKEVSILGKAISVQSNLI